MNEVIIWAQERDSKLLNVAYEVSGEGKKLAQSLGAKLSAVLIGSKVSNLTQELGELGVQKVYLSEDPSFAQYTTEGVASIFGNILKNVKPLAVLMGATFLGRDLSARIAARSNGALVPDVVSLTCKDGKISARRPMYAGKVMADVLTNPASIPVFTLRPNVFPRSVKSPGQIPEIEKISPPTIKENLKTIFKEIVSSAGTTLDVTEADIIVSGGRGMKDASNYKLLFDFAKSIGGAVGASRAAVDAGWIGHEHQIGQTGKTVSPTLYFACGISGAIQHLAGMSSSKVIVAINRDPDANIFKVANYGIVGDLFQVLPVLSEEIKKIRAM